MNQPSVELLSLYDGSCDVDDFDEDSLIEVLKEIDDIYENYPEMIDSFDLTDTKYDNLYTSVKRLFPSNEYFLGVGSATRSGKIDLPYKMGSLNQLYTENDIIQWVKQYNLQDQDLIISAKYDGNASECIFSSNGSLQISFSRGDGHQGADTTRHVKHVVEKYTLSLQEIQDTVRKISKSSSVDLRGEIICPKSKFDNNRTSMNGYVFKNPRNMVAGLMNKSASDVSILKNLEFIPFNIDNISGQCDKKEQLDMLKAAGFACVRYIVMKGKDINAATLTNIIHQFRDEEDYELDGVVIEVNNAALRSKIQPKNDSLNPEYAIKFKENAAAVSVTVTHVEWNVSKHGYLKPTVVYEPVNIQGVTCTRATGFNAGFVISNGIGPGAVINIVRSGDVIPTIVCVVKPMPIENMT